MTRIGNFIKEKRKERNIRSAELSRLTGLSPTSISRIENGERKSPSVESVYKISKALNVDINEMIEIIVNG